MAWHHKVDEIIAPSVDVTLSPGLELVKELCRVLATSILDGSEVQIPDLFTIKCKHSHIRIEIVDDWTLNKRITKTTEAKGSSKYCPALDPSNIRSHPMPSTK